jgi:EAL domain-containing protein (putative c-di-GMP-specific phosphodiesterase class I)/DNA-binding response OmpR family regulator
MAKITLPIAYLFAERGEEEMYVVVDSRADVTAGYSSSLTGEGIASLGFDPTEFREWFRTVSKGDIEAVQSFVLGEFDGRTGCSESIRNRSPAPIIALSDVRSLEQTLELFMAGIDDVVRKPVHVKEIIARSDAVWRRVNRVQKHVTFDRMKIYLDGRDLEIDGEPLPLPRRERRILEFLVLNGHRRVTKTQIFNAVYGIFEEHVDEVVVEGHVSKLRKKLRQRLGREVIDAKRYLGYQFVGGRGEESRDSRRGGNPGLVSPPPTSRETADEERVDRRVQFHAPRQPTTDADPVLAKRRMLEASLRSALAAKEFQLVFQPTFNVKDNRICGVEALLRWEHPALGSVPPSEFVSIAEEAGLLVAIGEWVMTEACSAAATWPAHVKVSVNLSPSELKSPNLVLSVKAALAAAGLSPQRLELEITESVLLAGNPTTLNVLHELRALGIGISMDDFGTGYSSLSFLRSFPFDKIKIDRSFVRDTARKDGLALVKAVVGLGRSLGIATSAEGVETEAELDIIREEGCTEVQGFLFSSPLGREAAASFLRH